MAEVYQQTDLLFYFGNKSNSTYLEVTVLPNSPIYLRIEDQVELSSPEEFVIDIGNNFKETIVTVTNEGLLVSDNFFV